ncbi:protein of unknown function [Ruminococcaceae bacterium BL-4]|jgi:hypothetical protein|nr:protein of unknown function [Ruminococcaceae bacterium BL-4]
MVLNRLVVPDGDFTRYPESMYFMKYMKLSGRFFETSIWVVPQEF